MDLIQYSREEFHLPEELAARFDSFFIRKEFKKKEQLLDAGNLSKKVFFVERGLARTYYTKDDKDITHLFFSEGSVSLAVESIFYNSPSPYGLEVLEDSVLRIADYRVLQEFLSSSPELQRLVQKLLIDVVKLFSDRLYSLQFKSAKERYDMILQQHPSILLRAPLGCIASYLGMTQQRLSVIRAGQQ